MGEPGVGGGQGVGCQSPFSLTLEDLLGPQPWGRVSGVRASTQSALTELSGLQETEDAPAATPVERREASGPGVHGEVVRPLPACAGAAAEPGGRVPGLQPPCVLRVPRVPEQDPRLEVHRVLRGQVRMAGRLAGGARTPPIQ